LLFIEKLLVENHKISQISIWNCI